MKRIEELNNYFIHLSWLLLVIIIAIIVFVMLAYFGAFDTTEEKKNEPKISVEYKANNPNGVNDFYNSLTERQKEFLKENGRK